MKLIVGLGNPDKEYWNTRHNLGHWLVERLVGDNDFDFRVGCVFTKADAVGDDGGSVGGGGRGGGRGGGGGRDEGGGLPTADLRCDKNKRSLEFVTKGYGVVLARNAGFINNSGRDVLRLAREFGSKLSDLLIVHDDFDLPLGRFKLQFNRSAAGHKGVQSVINELGSKAFWRLRVGIGKPPAGVDADDYVVASFSPSEWEVLESLYPQLRAAVEDWLLQK
jgi:aminoacyl-tRNA hydrolase